jgi:hypothetical protein
MVYGWECVIFRRSNLLMTYSKIMFFWLSLSTMKSTWVLFIQIYEWKRHSSSSRSFESYGWIFVVLMVALGSASMIYFLLAYFESEFKSRSKFFSLSSTNNDSFEKHSSMLCQGIFWNSHHFLVPPFFNFTSFPMD